MNKLERLLSGDVVEDVAVAIEMSGKHFEESKLVEGEIKGIENLKGILASSFVKGTEVSVPSRETSRKREVPLSLENGNNGFFKRGRGRPKGTYKEKLRMPPIKLGALLKNMPYTEIINLKPRHIKIIELYLQGMRREEIAVIIGVHVQTVTNVCRSIPGGALIERRFKDSEKDMDVLIGPVSNVYRDILTDPNPDRKLQAKVADSYLRLWKGRGVTNRLEVSGPEGKPIEVAEVKSKLLRLAGVSEKEVIEATYQEAKNE